MKSSDEFIKLQVPPPFETVHLRRNVWCRVVWKHVGKIISGSSRDTKPPHVAVVARALVTSWVYLFDWKSTFSKSRHQRLNEGQNILITWHDRTKFLKEFAILVRSWSLYSCLISRTRMSVHIPRTPAAETLEIRIVKCLHHSNMRFQPLLFQVAS